MHKHFKVLITNEGYSSAKEIIEEIAYAFTVPDGNYIQQFQTTGFNARLWELFLYAFFHESKFEIHRNQQAPDFHIEKNNVNIFVEAVTLNPGANMPPAPKTNDEIFMLLRNFMPIRFGGALFSKLSRKDKVKYWDMPHVKGNPLVLAVHDYTYDNSMTWTRTALETYLYGFWHEAKRDESGKVAVTPHWIESHTWGDKTIPSGFFNLPDSENISAVIFTNTGTLPTFNRMGFLAEFGSNNVKMVRSGTSFILETGDRVPFEKAVILDQYTETWGEAVMMFHNRKALNPIDERLFPNIAHITFEGEHMMCQFPDFYPIDSVTSIMVDISKEKKL